MAMMAAVRCRRKKKKATSKEVDGHSCPSIVARSRARVPNLHPIQNTLIAMSNASDLIKNDIDAYLAQHERKEILRFLTCGSVDDGKSTLIGRLLYDSKMIYEDQLLSLIHI